MESSHPSCRNVFQVHQCIDPLKVERTEYPSWITQVLAFESPIGLIKYPSFDMARRSTQTLCFLECFLHGYVYIQVK